MALPPRHPRAARRPRLLAVLTATVLLATGTAVPALADPTPPSQDEVDSARQDVVDAASSVAAMDVQMARLTQTQQAAFDAAATAGEAYNQSLVDVDAATAAAGEARERSDAANLRAEASRSLLVGLARDTSRNGGAVDQIGMYLSADGVSDAVSKANAMDLVGSKADKAAQQYQADSVVASTLQGIADTAVADETAKKEAAGTALQASRDAQAAADSAVASADVERQALLTRLAEARSTSVEVEQERQAGLQAERDAAAERAARDRVVAATPSTPAAPGTTPATPVAPGPGAPAAPAPTTPTVPPVTTPTTPPTTPVAPPVVSPPVVTPPVVTPPVVTPPVVTPPSGGGLGTGSSRGSAAQGQAAVDWARTKIGLPYVWGAAGPDAYDCSGLTSKAWGAAGVSINRTSRDQYRQVLKISLDSMRPGDLVFWGNNPADPTTITHVALYAGNNQIVEAPRPGVPLRVTSMRWDNRLMPYAGRP